MDIADDHLAIEEALADRLKAELPVGVTVLTAPELNKIQAKHQPVPAVHVIYYDDSVPVTESARVDDGAAQTLGQVWITVIAVRNVRDMRGGSGNRRDAGPLISATLRALGGWRPDIEGVGPLRRVPGPRHGTDDDGFAYFPLAFEATIDTGD